ncbi:MAG TPA: ferrous iron transport protein B, partial [Clostridiales bacterium]|nr:ferrous iron transport protein B [Clostridiales bacterium]
LALNMMDELLGNHGSVDIQKLSDRLGIPVVPIAAAKNDGVDELMRVVAETAENAVKPRRIDFCSAGPVHRCIHTVSHVVEDHADKIGVPSRFAATRVIEEDAEIISALKLSDNELELIGHAVLEMENEGGLDRNAALAEMRYRFIEAVCSECVIKAQESKEMLRSVKIDKVLTNKYLAIPTFIAIMGFIFWMTFSVLGKWLSDLLALGINEVTALVDNALTAYGLNPVVHSLVIDGVFAGVGSMLSFLPIIVVLFFFLAILEDTGYMSRVAFVMDKLLRRIGLSGRSFVPMLIGFGCSVPAIMATRTLSSERDRKMTMLLIPFMSCSAKIPIYAVFTAAFFPDHRGLVMTCLYVFGMLVGIIAAKVLSKTAFTGKPVPFVMELPNYRMPSLKSVLLLMWEKAWDFIRRAFTVIFAATIVIWFLQHFDVRLNVVGEGSTDSLLAIIGTWIAPVFAPLGFGDWRVATALLTGLMAKEAVISTLGVLMNVGANLGSAALGGLFTLPSAVSFLVFCLLYTPCVAALAALRRELGSGVKTVLVMISQCCVAWLAAFCVYALIGVIF